MSEQLSNLKRELQALKKDANEKRNKDKVKIDAINNQLQELKATTKEEHKVRMGIRFPLLC